MSSSVVYVVLRCVGRGAGRAGAEQVPAETEEGECEAGSAGQQARLLHREDPGHHLPSASRESDQIRHRRSPLRVNMYYYQSVLSNHCCTRTLNCTPQPQM